jgi:adenylyltransferase/sulfurtransferase
VTSSGAEDRFERLRLIPWWDQQKLAGARVLVVGAGALGNEILKNLALLGAGRVVVVDFDRIETSNLSRAVLFRSEDVGEFKAVTAARRAARLSPAARFRPIVGDVVRDCGLGLLRWADLILAGLDNREARLWINRAAWKVNRPWIDGAIEGINGVARVFRPGQPPCYECTLGQTDWEILNRRMSCNLLAQSASPEGKVPTTPTISAIIAGIQVQEAVKLLHGLPVLAGRGYVFEGLNHTSYVVEYTENRECLSHYVLETVVEVEARSSEISLAEMLQRARQDLGREAVLEFSRDIIDSLTCPRCGRREEVFAPVGGLARAAAQCPGDGAMRAVSTVHGFTGAGDYGGRTLSEMGLPPYDILTARAGDREAGYLMAGDAETVLGKTKRQRDRETKGQSDSAARGQN